MNILLRDLIDPITKENLTLNGNTLYSSTYSYEIIDGIPSFVKDKEEIYGGGQGNFNTLADGVLLSKGDNPIIALYNKISCSQNRIAFIEEHLKKTNAVILDMGCGGGGLAILYKKYSKILIGLDIAFNSLKSAAKTNLHDLLVHVSIEKNPFPDNYFDVIVSSDVLGHTFFETKEKVYNEMYRILKSNGVMIHVIETDSTNFWIKTAKKNPQLYKENHINKHGHIGMELPSTIINRCKKIGFDIIDVSKIHAIIVPPKVLISWFDGKFDRPLWLDWFLWISKIIVSSDKYIQYLFNFALGFIEKPLNKIIPIDWTTGLLLCARKPKHNRPLA